MIVRVVIYEINIFEFWSIKIFCLAIIIIGMIQSVSMISMVDMWSRPHIGLRFTGMELQYIYISDGRIIILINKMLVFHFCFIINRSEIGKIIVSIYLKKERLNGHFRRSGL